MSTDVWPAVWVFTVQISCHINDTCMHVSLIDFSISPLYEKSAHKKEVFAGDKNWWVVVSTCLNTENFTVLVCLCWSPECGVYKWYNLPYMKPYGEHQMKFSLPGEYYRVTKHNHISIVLLNASLQYFQTVSKSW